MGGDEVIAIRNKEDFQEAVDISQDKLVVFDFYATWCGPCKVIAPKLESLWKGSDKFKNNIAVYKVDVDEAEDVALELGISAMPTFFFYRNKEKVDTIVGANVDELKTKMEKHCP